MPVLSSTDKFTKLYRGTDDEMLRINSGRTNGFTFQKFIAIAIQMPEIDELIEIYVF